MRFDHSGLLTLERKQPKHRPPAPADPLPIFAPADLPVEITEPPVEEDIQREPDDPLAIFDEAEESGEELPVEEGEDAAPEPADLIVNAERQITTATETRAQRRAKARNKGKAKNNPKSKPFIPEGLE